SRPATSRWRKVASLPGKTSSASPPRAPMRFSWARRVCVRWTWPPRCASCASRRRDVVRVKICGITNVEDARVSVEAGADALGLNFVEGTPRLVTPAHARAVLATRPRFGTPVGIFWDHPAGHVKAVAEECGLRALQFHGDEAPEDVAQH